MTKLETSEYGMVLEPQFHDGYLTGMIFDHDNVELFLKTVDQKAFKLTLNGVRTFTAEGVDHGNLIFDLHVLSGRRPPADLDLDDAIPPAHPSLPPDLQDLRRNEREQLLDCIAAGSLTLCWNTASIGASFVALCQSASLAFLGIAETKQRYEP